MQSITLPQKPKFIPLDEKTGKFIIEGCYPGYGTTLGNALRRVLLSSLGGSAITAVKIKGATHEFSTIANVKEDIIQIILNLKQVRFRLFKDDSVKVTLKAKGEKAVTAGMITCSSDIEVVNKEAPIASLTSPKSEIEIEMEIKPGIGYVPVEQQERENKEVGVIAVDAIYTPVKRVNYTIDNMRVGKKTDYEKINLEISTDGSISPQEAFSRAVVILVDQFSVLLKLDETDKKIEKEKKEETESEDENESRIKDEKAAEAKENQNVQEIEVKNLRNLSTRTLNVLEKNKVEKVEDILKLSELQLEQLDGMGAKGIKEIKKAIGDYGFNLRKEK